MKPPRWSGSEWADANLLLEARAAGACEKCGKECGPVQRHHRKRRREGGDSLENLLFVGAGCHQQIHAHPVEARKFGWIVSAYVTDPGVVPVLWRGKEWCLFTAEGGRVDAFAPAE
jgi:hypothetical protein